MIIIPGSQMRKLRRRERRSNSSEVTRLTKESWGLNPGGGLQTSLLPQLCRTAPLETNHKISVGGGAVIRKGVKKEQKLGSRMW